MNEKELKRKLESVGYKQFVNYFYMFQSYANEGITREDCIECLVRDGVSNNNGASWRCSGVRPIFIENLECQALTIIKASRLPQDIIKKSINLIDENCQKKN